MSTEHMDKAKIITALVHFDEVERALRLSQHQMAHIVRLIEQVMGEEGAKGWQRPDPAALVAEIYASLADPLYGANKAIDAIDAERAK